MHYGVGCFCVCAVMGTEKWDHCSIDFFSTASGMAFTSFESDFQNLKKYWRILLCWKCLCHLEGDGVFTVNVNKKNLI